MENGLNVIRAAGYLNSKPAVVVIVFRQPGANIIETVERVRAQLPSLQASIPQGIDFTMVLDRSGPTLLVRILIGVPIRPPETWTPEAVEAWTHFEVNLRFNDIDSLELSEFNHQNVILAYRRCQ